MALPLALIISVITLVSMYLFTNPAWLMPPFISEYGESYDSHFKLTLTVIGILFFFSQLGLAYAVFRYRDRGGRAHYSHGNSAMELLWTGATAIVFVGLAILGAHIWAQAHFEPPRSDALKVELWGQQFAWYVRYPGRDGRFGRTKPELMKESSGNPLGLDPEDPTSKDDVVMPILAVPVNRQIDLQLRSKDVIHNFFVRELRIKQDAVPGLETGLHFTASKIGRYEIPCSELCGLGHYQMRSFLQVMSQEDFEKWLQENAPPQ